jgi:type IV pilus assembly protein PilC
MAEFVVKIADDRGRVHQHVEQGYSEAEVRDRFSSQGYLVYWVKPQGMMAGGLLQRKRKLKQDTFLVFNQQFLTLIRAGLPILNSLELLIKRQKDAQLKQLLENVRDRVKGGELLSDAFAYGGREERQY